MDIFESLIVYVIVIGALVLFILWDQVRVFKLKRRVHALEDYIKKYNVPIEDDSVK